MKHKIISLLAVLLIWAMLLSGCSLGIDHDAKCLEYEQSLGGFTYSGYDSTSTARNGDVRYDYKMDLNADGSCKIHFSATRTGDKGTFANNGTWGFDLSGITWDVEYEEGEYWVVLSGDMDWQDWSAATLERSIKIIDQEDSDPILQATRSGYYEFCFTK